MVAALEPVVLPLAITAPAHCPHIKPFSEIWFAALELVVLSLTITGPAHCPHIKPFSVIWL